MAVLYNGSGSANSLTLNFLGDGQTSVVSVDLAVAPLNIVFNGNFPQQSPVQLDVSIDGTPDPSFSVDVTYRRSIATFTFNKAMPIVATSGSFITVFLSNFSYHGV